MVFLMTINGRPFTVNSDWKDLDGTASTYTDHQITGSYRIGVAWKYAVLADETTPSYTFSTSEAFRACVGMICISGAASSSPISTYATANTDNTASPSFANTITPTVADCLIVLAALCNSTNASGSGTAGSYAIVTSNPTWTEGFEKAVEGGADDQIVGVVAGVRAATTATGNSSLTWGGAGSDTDSGAFLIAIKPAVIVGPVNLKTLDGATSANVKTRNGVTYANIKAINGIT